MSYGHTDGTVGSLLVLMVEAGTGECCDSEERSDADQLGRHRVGEIVCGRMPVL